MCIAILKLKDGTITDEELRTSFRRNNDGGGVAYTVNNELIVKKGIFGEDEFVQTVREAEQVADNNMLIHCRIGTSGGRNTHNCHPHLIRDNICVIHNGIIYKYNNKEKENSDTVIYARDILSKLSDDDLLTNPTIQYLIESDIGTGNKFVIMDNLGRYKIFNENSGHWKNNVWFSNETYKPIKYPTNFNSCTSTYSGCNNFFKRKALTSLLSETESATITKIINGLSDEMLLEIGEYPMVEISGATVTLAKDLEVGEYLMDLDEDLSDLYTMKLNKAIENKIKNLSEETLIEAGGSPFINFKDKDVEFTKYGSVDVITLSAYSEELQLTWDDMFEKAVENIKLNPKSTEILEKDISCIIENLDEQDYYMFDSNNPMYNITDEMLEYGVKWSLSSGDVRLSEISDSIQQKFIQKGESLGITFDDNGNVVDTRGQVV